MAKAGAVSRSSGQEVDLRRGFALLSMALVLSVSFISNFAYVLLCNRRARLFILAIWLP